MSKQSQRTKILNAYCGSDIFHSHDRNSPERRLLDKKIKVNQRPKDSTLFPSQESSKVISVSKKEMPEKTGKRLEKKKTSDIFFIKKKLRHSSIDNDLFSRQVTLNGKGTSVKNKKHKKNLNKTDLMQSTYNAMNMTVKANTKADHHISIHLKPQHQWKSVRSVEGENHNYQRSSSSRDHKIKSFHSNIFFDQDKEKSIALNDNKGETVTPTQMINEGKSTGKFTNWVTQLDWKNINTEIHFNMKQSRSLSAFERRQQEYKTTYTNENANPNVGSGTTYNSSLDCKNCLDRYNQSRSVAQVKNIFSSYTRNIAKLAKQYENYSTVQANATADACNRNYGLLTENSKRRGSENISFNPSIYQEKFIESALNSPAQPLSENKVIPIPGLRDSDNRYRTNDYTYVEQYRTEKSVKPITENSYNLLNKKFSERTKAY